jgi:NAD(P)-dependent dehydrogenase (short-subunit alcohol dehydrogenase family)
VSERLKGKLAFVTAAGQGIGFAIAEAFLLEGASVIATDLSADKLKNLKTDKIFALDVRSTEKVDALAATVIDKFGPPNILVNCAGYVHQGSVLDCSENDWDFSFDPECKVHASHATRLSPGHAEEWRRLHHQYFIRGVVNPRRAQSLRLWRQQGRGHRADQGGRRRFHHARHSLQCDMSRDDPVTVARWAYHRHRQQLRTTRQSRA